MPDISTAQWVFGGMIAVGLLLAVIPFERIRKWFAGLRLPDLPVFEPDPADELMDRLRRLSELQGDLEARGHKDEAEMAGTWYALLRAPVTEVEP